MTELTTADVEAFTKGRLKESDDEVGRLLNAALAAARRYTGWHVSPVREADEITVDGPGGTRLKLPTKRIISVDSMEEDGETLAADTYVLSADVPGLVVRRKGCWTREFSGITVTLDHGYAEAEDWRQAILTMVDQMSLIPIGGSGRSNLDLTRKRIDDVEYQWSDGKLAALAEGVLFSVESLLFDYRIDPVFFA
ncbi:head-to-tail adaptor [Mycobacterium phage prophiGD91-2]|uniref:hypothetical protein n=1 Tax=Mycobacteroides abscessus TaxID=36809 RepID=UPI000927901A|nr:hypothetical protein [Mycobacteroides abscessus]QSM03942.1 head-to-tail adaptor [Mycobacterium phage prophiGD91-2]QSM90539.1 hypothetical protein I3U44_07680 [Mycobacteroides abscessus subsp. bolletii]QSM90823.1 hypothetical protein I3U44_09315 [Mycobacteroides abscessus subsp. bolletii]SIJ01230.1 Uncharacterised protein [Mycobacteroides abscessus subsp. bolletii]SLD36619.1 Uncharacterised protein [Mycobacteroides abscessus subsp. bolletii]